MGNIGYKGYLSRWFFTARRFYFCFNSSHAHLEREVLSSFRPQGCLELSDDQTFGGIYVLQFTAWHFLFHTYTKQKPLTHFALHVSAHPRKHSAHFCSGTARITTEKAVKNNQKIPPKYSRIQNIFSFEWDGGASRYCSVSAHEICVRRGQGPTAPNSSCISSTFKTSGLVQGLKVHVQIK